MGEIIAASSSIESIEDSVRAAFTTAVAREGEIAEAGLKRFGPAVKNIDRERRVVGVQR